MQKKRAHKGMCHGARVTGIVGCFAFYPPKLLLNTIRADSVKYIKLGDLATLKPPLLYQF